MPRPSDLAPGWGSAVLLGAAAALLTAAGLPGPVRAQGELDGPPPAGWEIRTDRPGADTSGIVFVDMPPGWHITTGPAAIFYHPDSVASGEFSVESEVFLFDPGGRREAFGFFVGGTDLAGPGQRYLYFLIRDGGEFLVKERDGADTSTLVNWTAHDAILGYDQRDEGGVTVRNVLGLDAREDRLVFRVNGEEVMALPRGNREVDGVVGLRVNHALNLHVSTLEITR